MGKEIIYEDLGLIPYADAWDYQEKLFRNIVEAKRDDITPRPPNHLLFCEHPHVYTLGKSGSEGNLLINEQTLKAAGATFYRTNRGGDITYHGPGQIVGYPILDLEQFNLGIRRYIEILEESVIRLLENYGLKAGRLAGASGVWLDPDVPSGARKICAIGVRSSRYVTMHGFAFNINTNLEYYGYINPCGFKDKGVTSMKNELGREVDIEEIRPQLRDILTHMFQEH